MTNPPITRRAALTAVGGGAIALGLVACSPVGSSSSGDAPTKDAAGGESMPLKDVPVGNGIVTQVNGQTVVVAQPEQGTVTAFSAICTHQGCAVAPNGLEFDCPCHGSRFSAKTGAVLQGPAKLPLPKVKVVLEGDTVSFPN